MGNSPASSPWVNRRGKLHLDTGEGVSRWRNFDTSHCLSSEARDDWPLHDDSGVVPIRWAVPLDRLDRSGHFWTYFPTKTASLVAGILNAPWKTNEDRQNLLPGPYQRRTYRSGSGNDRGDPSRSSPPMTTLPGIWTRCRVGTRPAIPDRSIFFANVCFAISMEEKSSPIRTETCARSAIFLTRQTS